MFRSFRSASLGLTLLVLATGHWPLATGQAAKVKVWHHHTASHYEKARLRGAVVSSEGALRLSRDVRPLASLGVAQVWDVVEDKAGNLFVATGDDGKIFKVAPDGKATVAYTGGEGVSQILCLALAPDGSIYAGTGPKGTVVRIDPKGEAKVLFEEPDYYIWSLAVDAEGKNIYAGTGPKGRIYRVKPDGTSCVYYHTQQEHILCVALGPDGTLYAGTDKAGLVYRIDAKSDKGFVIFSAPQAEVRRLVVTADAVYAATSSPTRRRSTAGSAAAADIVPVSYSRLSGPTLWVSRLSGEKPAEAEKTAAPSEVRDKEPARAGPTAAPAPPATGENSIYRIAHDGTVREVFREKVLMLSLLRQDGRFFVGTGMEGQLFEVNEAPREHSEIARLDHGQVLSLLRRRDGSIVVGTGDPGRLYVLQDRHVSKGTVVSEVLDAKLISRWGALRWKAETPAGTSVTVAVRSGNLAEPDDTWSDWSSEQTDAQAAILAAPPARFLQYRVTQTTSSPSLTPVFRGLTLRYATTNQPPDLTSIEVPDLDAVNLENPKKLKVKWNATDANEDELTYNLYVRKDGWSSWVLLEEDFEKREYEWDTTTAPSGVYQLKVVASDRRDNPAEDALAGERVSAPFVVSHVPPEVAVKLVGQEGGQLTLEATATAPLARLTAASFSINGKKWVNVFPGDGLFDSKSETFRFKVDGLKVGTHVLVLRVKDAAGNTGSGDVVFQLPMKAAQR